jgi:hypothetical protein
LKVRRIVEDYEARLTPPVPERSGSGASAKAEHERFADGVERFKVRIRKLALREGTSLDILLGDAKVGSTVLENGSALFVIESGDGRSVPRVAEGDRIAVVRGDVTLLAGVFVRD